MTKITETPAPSADTLSPASTLFRDLQSLKLSIEKVEAEVNAFISLQKRTTGVAFRETLNQAIESNMDFASSSFLPGAPQLHEVAASDREDLHALARRRCICRGSACLRHFRRVGRASDVRPSDLTVFDKGENRIGAVDPRVRCDLRPRTDDPRYREIQATGRGGVGRLYITAAYWFTSLTSFANPAITVVRGLSNTFAGIAPHDVPMFVVAQFAGAIAATAIASTLFGEPFGPSAISPYAPES